MAERLEDNSSGPKQRPQSADGVMVRTLRGQPVRDTCGAVLGEVSDTIIDCSNGTVTHLVVRTARSIVYLPWQAVNVASHCPPGELRIEHRPVRRAG